MRYQLLILGLCVSLGNASAQPLTNASLNAKYYFVHLLVTAMGGQAANAQNLTGAITFNGTGGYTFTGKQGDGAGPLTAKSGSGTYSVAATGSVTISNPIRPTLQLAARLSGDGNVLVGSSTEASDNANDIFVGIKAPTATVNNSVLYGAYTGGTVLFPNGNTSALKSAIVALTAGGNGQFSAVTVTGHAVDQSSRNVSQQATGSSYSINGDGSGMANFGSAASLFAGAREIFVSQDGNYLLAYSTANGGRDIFIATKNFSASANAASLNGRYWIAELTLDSPGTGTCTSFSFSGASGALVALGDGRVLFSERLHLDTKPLDFSGLNIYKVNGDSTGLLAPLSLNATNMALGASVSVGGTPRPNTVVGAQVGALNAVSCQYGVFFAALAPTASGSGVFVGPAGVVNNAGFAPFPSPVSPGAITSAFGSGLAPRAESATVVPLPATLAGVQLFVNGTPAPLFSVQPGQIDFQTPFGLTGSTVTIQVNNGGAPSNPVVVPLAPTGPGFYQYSDCPASGGCGPGQSLNRGIVLHADFSLVTLQKPAQPGETVVIFLNGLGALNPAVATGAANPGTPPLANAVDNQIQILFGGEVATNVPFIGGAPGFVGLNQINVVIPTTVIGGANVPVAIATSNAFNDVVDIPIGI